MSIPNVVLLAETKESSDLGSTLGTKSLGLDDIGQAGNIFIALLDNGKSEHSKILTDNAASNGLAFSFTGAARSVAGVAIGEEELNSSRKHLCEDKSQRMFLCAGAFMV